MTRTRQPRIERARSVLERERERTTVERRALDRFVARLRSVDVAPPPERPGGAGAGGTVALAGRRRSTGATESIREAYRETVMAVPHYDAEYDEPLAANLAAEVGADLAAQVLDDGPVTPMAYVALVTGARRAARDREQFESVLDREASSLRTVEQRLDEAERRAVEAGERAERAATSADLAALDAELAALERDCERVATERQRTIHGRSSAEISGVDGSSLAEYLYADADLDTTCPALADVADCLETIRGYRRRCLR
ncbi:MAG: hypothetical protein ABEJ61_10515 [Haloferacaceae archaeon]